MSSSSSSSSESNSKATSKEDLKDLSTSTPANEDKTTLPTKCETGGTATLGHVSSDVSPSENHREERHRSKLSSVTSVRHRSKTHTQLMKETLGQIKAEMQKISKVHLLQRPERKAYHPFVWNSLSPYRDTTEIDHLLTTTTEPDRRNRYSSVKTESTQLSK
uniref:Si:ch211-186j3.3 n=1 Tax=Cyprinus carpio carpio TaxID=630221 RepID=A0A9J7Y7D0_CYPCA